MRVISIEGLTLPVPTRITAYADDEPTVINPIDGTVITQVSNQVDTYGSKNAVREMVWDLIPQSGIFDGVTLSNVNSLKALEGTQATLNASGHFGYDSTNREIVILGVSLGWKVYSQSLGINFYECTLTYTHV